MRAVPHMLIGASCGLLITGAHFSAHPEIIGLSVLGALLPDVDHAQSKLGRMTWPVSTIVHRLLGHRGPFHSLLFAVLFGLVVFAVTHNTLAGWALCLGYVSHLLADGLSRAGVPYLWPMPWKVRLLPEVLRFRSGTWWVEWPLALGIFALCWR